MVEKNFDGKTVIVFGGSTGIGRETAILLAQRGANVVISSRSDAGQETTDDINNQGGTAMFVRCDVSEEDQVKNVIDKTVEAFGSLDATFNNAGILNEPTKFADVDLETYETIMNVNAKGIFLGTKYSIQYMREHGGGVILNTASIAGLTGTPTMTPYVASKHAVVGLTKAAALDHTEDGIRINAIAPGSTATDIIQNDAEPVADEDNPIPMKRSAEPEEIARLAVFLLSDDSSYCNGSVYVADGGLLAN